MKRRGVTLLELLLVLSLLGIVGSIVSAMVLAASRMGARAVAQLAAERTLQVTAAFFRRELAGAAWRDVAVAPDSVDLPRPVGEGAVCATSGAVLWVRRSSWSGVRAPDATRDRLVTWPGGGITAVRESLLDVATATCPDAAPAWRMTRSGTGAVAEWVRVEEPVTVRRYRVGGNDWVGLREAGAPVQPFAGPLVAGASRFARIGDVLQLDLVTTAGAHGLALPLGTWP